MSERLRVVVLLDPPPTPGWVHTVLAELAVSSQGAAAGDPATLLERMPQFLHRMRHVAGSKSAALLASALADPKARGLAPDDVLPVPRFDPLHRAPWARDVVRFAAARAVRVLRNRWRQRRSYSLWFVALRPARKALATGSLEGFRPIAAPPGRFFADPFLVEDAGRLWLFVEDAGQASRKGVIRCAEVLADGSLGESRVVLERDHHLSYPFVVRTKDGWFPLPETSGHRTVELDETAYRETPIRRIDPGWFPGASATHTLNRAGGFDAIDARGWVSRGRSVP